MANLAGGDSAFVYSSDPSNFISDAFNGGAECATGTTQSLYNSATDTITCPPKVGEIVCYGTGSQDGWTFEDFQDWFDTGSTTSVESHCDVVVAVSTSTSYTVETVGGDLDDSIALRFFSETDFQNLYTLRLTLGARTDILDVVFCTDVSGSFFDDISNFQDAAPTIICGKKNVISYSFRKANFNGMACCLFLKIYANNFQTYSLPKQRFRIIPLGALEVLTICRTFETKISPS